MEEKGMKKGILAGLVMLLLLGFTGYTVAQTGPQNPCAGGMMGPQGQQMMGQGQMGLGMGTGRQVGPGMGMMGQMGHDMGMMGSGMGMMGPMMGSPEIMGTMMSIRGEIMSLMGRLMQQYGATMGQMTPEIQQQIHKQMLKQMGEILTKHGMALRERAKAASK
jgi:hypothetical protein